MNRAQLEIIVGALVQSDTTLEKIMQAVDEYTIAIEDHGREVWTAEQVASHTGASSPDSARVWCSRNGIKAIGSRSIPGQRGTYALYPADLVRMRARR